MELAHAAAGRSQLPAGGGAGGLGALWTAGWRPSLACCHVGPSVSSNVAPASSERATENANEAEVTVLCNFVLEVTYVASANFYELGASNSVQPPLSKGLHEG